MTVRLLPEDVSFPEVRAPVVSVLQAQHGQCSAHLLIEGMAFVFQAAVHPERHLSP